MIISLFTCKNLFLLHVNKTDFHMKDCARPRFMPMSQSCPVPKSKKNSGGPLNNQTCQTEWKTVPVAKVQLCEYENQTLEAFVVPSRLSAKFDCPVTRQNFSLSASAHDCETG